MKNRMISILLASAIMISSSVPAGANGFKYKDVNEGDWYYEFVSDVHTKGIMTGYNDEWFGPIDKLTRGQFATILWRMDGCPTVAYDGKFPDVTEDQFYTNAVAWASQNNIITGYIHNGYFGPNDNITREQIATMLYRYAAYLGYDVAIQKSLEEFPDANYVSEFALNAMRWCVAEGIINGEGDTKELSPQDNTLRAICSTIISRFTSEREHVHGWVAQYKEVDNGYWDEIVIEEAWTEYKDIYETKWYTICNGCGLDITNNTTAHMKSQALAGNHACGSYRTVGEDVKVGTETIEHKAITEKVWVPKIEKELTGYKCSCGATK